ncbi:MAG TPA: hypothetical protein VJO12_00075 [Stellaceae bacterium]|nr:hypothetical protein [Stellaceae bacterium]
MRHIALVSVVGLALAACHHMSMEEGLSGYVGKPVNAAFGTLGYPTSEDKVPGGRKAYLWSKGDHECTVRMVVDDKETVVASDYQGSNHSCSAYLKAMRRG